MNIAKDNFDPYYRYKMPVLNSKIQGNKTILLNLEDVSKSFNHPEEIVFKYFGNFLGTNINFKKKSLSGYYDKDQLIDILYKYIQVFVLCPKCSIPEFIPCLETKKKKIMLYGNCSACGYYAQIKGNNNIEEKTIDNIKKYLEKNEWKISKGNLVNEEFDPFYNPMEF
jgi:translation initiation factor 5